MADDLGWNGIGVEDWDMTEATERWAMKHLSPTLHTLAAGGIPIRNYYSQEVCTPARAALLTGEYSTVLELSKFTQLLFRSIPDQPRHAVWRRGALYSLGSERL